MGTTVKFRATNYTVPTAGDTDWAADLNSYLSSLSRAVGVIDAQYTAVGNVGTGEDTLMTYTLPANSLVASGRGVRVKAWGTLADNVNAKTLKLHFGSVAILTKAVAISSLGPWALEAVILRASLSSQRCMAQLLEIGGPSVVLDLETSSPTQTETGAIVIKCTGTATDNNDIIQAGMLIEFL